MPASPLETPTAEPREPSDFSPDAPPTLLPKESPIAPPRPAQNSAPTESVLAPGVRSGTELKDAVIYFETPAGVNGSRIGFPTLVPVTSPPAPPQPPSKATFRQEKE